MATLNTHNLRKILPAMAAIFIDVLSYGLITPLIVAAFAEDVFLAGNPGMQAAAQSLAFALFPLGMFIGAATLGDLSDRWGRKRTLMLCMAGLTLAFTLMAVAVAINSAALLLLARLISGLLGGSVAIGQAAIIDLSTEDTKALNLSRITIANTTAHFLGPGIGALLADNGLYLPFICISLMAVGTMAWIAWGMEETNLQSETVKRLNWLQPLHIFSDAFRDTAIRKLSLAYLLFHAGNCMSYQYFYIYLAGEFDYSPGELSLFSTLVMGGGGLIATIFLLPRLQKYFRPLQLSVTPLALAGIMSLLFPLNMPMEVRWLLGFVWVIAVVVAYVSTLTLYSNCVDENRQGWVMGIAGSVFAFSFVLGGLSAVLLHWLSIDTMLLISGVLLLLSALCFQCNRPSS